RMERPVATSHFGDSGSRNHAAGSKNTTGGAPMRNSPRQPMASSNASAANDAITPPAETPEYAMALEKLPREARANSATRAPPGPTMMPTPKPVKKRRTPKAKIEVENAVSAIPMENHAMAVRNTRRRPRRSPIAPAESAPMVTPIIAQD